MGDVVVEHEAPPPPGASRMLSPHGLCSSLSRPTVQLDPQEMTDEQADGGLVGYHQEGCLPVAVHQLQQRRGARAKQQRPRSDGGEGEGIDSIACTRRARRRAHLLTRLPFPGRRGDLPRTRAGTGSIPRGAATEPRGLQRAGQGARVDRGQRLARQPERQRAGLRAAVLGKVDVDGPGEAVLGRELSRAVPDEMDAAYARLSPGGRSSGSGISCGGPPSVASQETKAVPSRPTCSPAPPSARITQRPGPRLT